MSPPPENAHPRKAGSLGWPPAVEGLFVSEVIFVVLAFAISVTCGVGAVVFGFLIAADGEWDAFVLVGVGGLCVFFGGMWGAKGALGMARSRAAIARYGGRSLFGGLPMAKSMSCDPELVELAARMGEVCRLHSTTSPGIPAFIADYASLLANYDPTSARVREKIRAMSSSAGWLISHRQRRGAEEGG